MPTSALVDPGERTGSVSTRSRSADTDKGWVGCVFVHRKGEGMVWEVKREGGMEWRVKKRQLQDSNLRGQSPTDFESVSLTTRTNCQS